MGENSTYQLEIWKGDWGLPSIDTNCLQILVYTKFCNIPVKVKATNNPFRSSTGSLPVLRTNNESIANVKDILAYFRSKNHNLDFSLSRMKCADTVAYENMLKNELYPAMQFIWWVEPRNLNEVIRPWYAKALPFPLNFYYPGKYENSAKMLMESLYPQDCHNLQDLETRVCSRAQKCLTLLDTRLGESRYFFGENPSTLDAIVYSYIAPLLKLQHNALQNHVKGCTNLVRFITQITQKYFESDYQNYEKQTSKKMMSTEDTEFPNRRRDQILAGLFATAAMMGYALSTGIVQVWSNDKALGDDTLDYIEEEDE